MISQIYCDATFDPRTGQSVIGWCDHFLFKKSYQIINAENINEAEFKAVSLAVKELGHEIHLLSDSTTAIETAKKFWPNLNIHHINSRDNVADTFISAIKQDKHAYGYRKKLLKNHKE